MFVELVRHAFYRAARHACEDEVVFSSSLSATYRILVGIRRPFWVETPVKHVYFEVLDVCFYAVVSYQVVHVVACLAEQVAVYRSDGSESDNEDVHEVPFIFS